MSVRRVPTINQVQTGWVVREGGPYPIVEMPPATCDTGTFINSRHESLERMLSETCLFGPRCLTFEGLAAPLGCGPDRLEVDVARAEEPNALRYGETRYLRFYLRVDPAVTGLGASPLISQVWQGFSVAMGKRPPLGPAFS
ncbi:MAG TPA: hypothetical protein VNG33_06225, partial [Polyangiaceae bacterium]|nr:hypothetical protein [Polyangiaceae bacterium]